MTQKHFEKVTEKLLDKTKQTLIHKNKEYTDTKTDVFRTDVLVAFKHASALVDQNLAKTLGGMLSKHIVSIYKMMDDPTSYPDDVWDEKIGDAINYLVLLKACIKEMRFEEECEINADETLHI